MQDLIEQLVHIIRGVGRYRWQALSVAWVICVIGWLVVMNMPNKYEAKTTFQVDTYSMLSPLLGGAAIDHSEKLRLTQMEVLSNTNIEKIIRKADLDLGVKTDAELDALVQSVKNKISFRKARTEDVYTITYTDTNPDTAKNIVQLLLDLFQEKALGDKRRDSDHAEKFLDEQIDRYRTQLQDVESRLVEFKQANINRLPEQGKDYYQRLQESKVRVREADLELKQVENELQTLKNQLKKEQKILNSTSIDADKISIPEIDERIAKLNGYLDDLLLRYTDKHPDVYNTQRLIETLQKQKQQIIKNSDPKNSKATLANPIYQQLKIAIGDAEARKAAIMVKVTEYRSREKELEALLHELPEVEEQLKELTRDYAILKQHHDEMVNKREQARVQKEKEQSSTELKFKLQDPPRRPTEPTGPNRKLFLVLVLVVACGAGLALAFILSQINTTFYDTKSLNSAVNLPVIGAVSFRLTHSQVRSRVIKRVLFVVIFLVLLMSFGAVMAIEVLNISFKG